MDISGLGSNFLFFFVEPIGGIAHGRNICLEHVDRVSGEAVVVIGIHLLVRNGAAVAVGYAADWVFIFQVDRLSCGPGEGVVDDDGNPLVFHLPDPSVVVLAQIPKPLVGIDLP